MQPLHKNILMSWEIIIPSLNGKNFKARKTDIMLAFGCLDLNYRYEQINVGHPKKIQESFEKWERSSHFCLMAFEWVVHDALKGNIDRVNITALEFLNVLKVKLAKNVVVETCTLLLKLT